LAAVAGLVAWCVLALFLPLPGSAGEALALGWPSRPGPARREAPNLASAQRLQEVAPPAAVQQLQEALAERQPKLRILEPAAEAVLPEGPWHLRLQVDDWPLVDAGGLGLGPHLLVRIDDGEPLRLTSPEATLPALSPGSHRLTVVAARPWGEAVKSPGALAQIRLHRTAANPLALPATGSPQLLPVSPAGALAGEPLLLDWLLIDAPLQHLRDDDAQWRLRVTVNGDSFLVDRQTPLWLRGWRPGSNALQLELLDGRGEPLNPPFNSLVQEVRLDPAAPRPAWSQGRLAPGDLAVLLGQSPPPPTPEPVASAPEEAEPRAAEAPSSEPPASEPGPAAPEATETQAAEPQAEVPQPEETQTAEPQNAQSSPETAPAEEEPTAEPPSPDSPAPEQQAPQPGPAEAAPAAPAVSSPAPSRQGSEAPPSPSSDPGETLEDNQPGPVAPAGPSASPEPLSPALRPAREEVNADGTLKREPAQGPLAGLRARLGR
jgi:hypothetical protein